MNHQVSITSIIGAGPLDDCRLPTASSAPSTEARQYDFSSSQVTQDDSVVKWTLDWIKPFSLGCIWYWDILGRRDSTSIFDLFHDHGCRMAGDEVELPSGAAAQVMSPVAAVVPVVRPPIARRDLGSKSKWRPVTGKLTWRHGSKMVKT